MGKGLNRRNRLEEEWMPSGSVSLALGVLLTGNKIKKELQVLSGSRKAEAKVARGGLDVLAASILKG